MSTHTAPHPFIPAAIQLGLAFKKIEEQLFAPFRQMQVHLDLQNEKFKQAVQTAARHAILKLPPPPIFWIFETCTAGTATRVGPAPRAAETAIDSLADDVASRFRASNFRSVKSLALEFRERFEELGLIREESTDDSMLRRFQEFLNIHVYRRRVALDHLPPRVQSGLRTGGLRQAAR